MNDIDDIDLRTLVAIEQEALQIIEQNSKDGIPYRPTWEKVFSYAHKRYGFLKKQFNSVNTLKCKVHALNRLRQRKPGALDEKEQILERLHEIVGFKP